jgi:hypothetical protein
MSSFFTCHTFLEVGKTQDLPSKIWQTLGDHLLYQESFFILFFHPPTCLGHADGNRDQREQLQQFGKRTWHPYNFGKTRKIGLQQFGKPTWQK